MLVSNGVSEQKPDHNRFGVRFQNILVLGMILLFGQGLSACCDIPPKWDFPLLPGVLASPSDTAARGPLPCALDPGCQAENPEGGGSSDVTGGRTGDWGMNSCSGTSLSDAVNGLNGTLINGVARGAGYSGQGLWFDGIDDYVKLGEPAELEHMFTGSFSISIWIKRDITDVSHTIISRGDNFVAQQNSGYFLMVNSSDKLYFLLRENTDANSRAITATTTIAAGTWYHVAAIRDRHNAIKLYVNGVQEATAGDLADDITLSASRQHTMGALNYGASGGPGAYFFGTMDEMRIYNRALTVEEITALAEKTLAPLDCSL